MSIPQWLFAVGYDTLNLAVEGRVTPYRRQTAGQAWGEVLEIGGGTGANLPFYRPGVRLTVAEPNPHMALRLRRRAAKRGREVAIVPAFGEELPFRDGSFDSVVTTLVLCMVGDLDRVVQETVRVLKPGGSFFFYEHVVSPRPPMRKWQDRANPLWRLLTTGCNLNRDISAAINAAKFSSVEVSAFDLSVGVPLTIPNIVGVARA